MKSIKYAAGTALLTLCTTACDITQGDAEEWQWSRHPWNNDLGDMQHTTVCLEHHEFIAYQVPARNGGYRLAGPIGECE